VERSEGAASTTVLKLRVDGNEMRVPFDDVERANTIYEFTSADFAKADSKSRSGTTKRYAKPGASDSSQSG
jgi:hypothetical protein